MKSTFWLPTLLFLACTTKEHKSSTEENQVFPVAIDTIDMIDEDTMSRPKAAATYSNERFREVIVEKIGDGEYRVTGQAQIFEANFNWVVEDGHNEIKSGYQMTDAGAPQWGDFDFILEVQKQEANSTLTLILFETSAKDGSRQHELPIVLE